MKTETFKLSPKIEDLLLGIHYDMSISPTDELELVCGLLMMNETKIQQYPTLSDALLTLSDIVKEERKKNE